MTDIDTSSCGYSSTPKYFTSLSGNSNHWSTTGATSIYSETATGFRVYIWMKGGVSTSYAAARNWRINWIAQMSTGTTSSCALSDNSVWRGYNGNVYTDVVTHECSHSTMPMYLASLSGRGSQWEAKGTSSIYSESANGYRVYLKRDESKVGNAASDNGWYINTLSLDRNQVPPGLCTGVTDSDSWKPYNDQIVIDIDTTSCKFTGSPRYLTSLSGDSNHWSTTGATSIYSETANGFRVYINKEGGVSTSYASARNWRINWVAVE